MSDEPDPLLGALGKLERDDERASGSVWEDRLAGRTSVGEAIDAAAMRPDEEAMLAAFFTAPIPQAEVDGLVERTLAGWRPQPAPVPAPAAVVPLIRRRTTWTAVASTLALAAAVTLWVRSEPREVDEWMAYNFAVRSPGVQVQRSDEPPADILRYRSDSTIDWQLNPLKEVAAARELRVLASDDHGDERLLAPPVERSPEGMLRLVGRLDALLPLQPGHWRLRFIVSAPGAAPNDVAAAAAARPAGTLEMDILP